MKRIGKINTDFFDYRGVDLSNPFNQCSCFIKTLLIETWIELVKPDLKFYQC